MEKSPSNTEGPVSAKLGKSCLLPNSFLAMKHRHKSHLLILSINIPKVGFRAEDRGVRGERLDPVASETLSPSYLVWLIKTEGQGG